MAEENVAKAADEEIYPFLVILTGTTVPDTLHDTTHCHIVLVI